MKKAGYGTPNTETTSFLQALPAGALFPVPLDLWIRLHLHHHPVIPNFLTWEAGLEVFLKIGVAIRTQGSNLGMLGSLPILPSPGSLQGQSNVCGINERTKLHFSGGQMGSQVTERIC